MNGEFYWWESLHYAETENLSPFQASNFFFCLLSCDNRRVFKVNFELEFLLFVFLHAENLLEGFVV